MREGSESPRKEERMHRVIIIVSRVTCTRNNDSCTNPSGDPFPRSRDPRRRIHSHSRLIRKRVYPFLFSLKWRQMEGKASQIASRKMLKYSRNDERDILLSLLRTIRGCYVRGERVNACFITTSLCKRTLGAS